MSLRIEDFGGARHANDEAEVASALTRRYGHDVNEFWLFHDERRAPALAIVVKGDLASLTYFPEGAHPGFTSVGTLGELDPNGSTTFSINSPSERHEVDNRSIVPTFVAVQAAQEFLRDPGLPSAAKWFEL
jgi:hypothetical protein